MSEFLLDEARAGRIGFAEAMFCAGKSAPQIAAILEGSGGPMLLTRLDAERLALLPAGVRSGLDYDPVSRTAFFGSPPPLRQETEIGVITAGTSDVPMAAEAVRTLRFNGVGCTVIHDIGVAGLWRLLSRLDEIRRLPVLIVAAGMDGALPTVLGGLVPGVIIALPTSVGYGVATGGTTALHAILASCAPGLVTVNVDNGYGAACAALRVMGGRQAVLF